MEISNINSLKEKIVELDTIKYIRNAMASTEFTTWFTEVNRLLSIVCGDESYEVRYFRETTYAIYAYTMNSSDEQYEFNNIKSVNIIKKLLEEIIFDVDIS